MAYDPSDLRSQLSSQPSRAPGAAVAAQYVEFASTTTDERSPAGSVTWWVRSQSAVVATTRLVAGDTLVRKGQHDEYMVLLPEGGTRVVATSGTDEAELIGDGVIVMPPGDSSITGSSDCLVARVFTGRNADLANRCANAEFYADADPNVAPFAPWPDPPAGHRIRVYPMAQVPTDPGRFGRLLRCSTMMVNFFSPESGPRDPATLSPHHHDDFEQLSWCVLGDYVHHLRYPWTPDIANWRDDEHQLVHSPSLTVIPPPAVHTSQGVGDTPHQLIDIFCPPRLDFSQRPGWVLNAGEYPMP